MVELMPCPFCGGKPIVSTTTRGSSIMCSRCGVRMEYMKLCGHYKSLAMAKKWTHKIVEEKWNNRTDLKGE